MKRLLGCLSAAAVVAAIPMIPASGAPAPSPCPLNVVPRDPGWTSIELPEAPSSNPIPSTASGYVAEGGEAFAVDPADPQRIFFGGAEKVHRSDDGGCSWKTVFPDVAGNDIQSPSPWSMDWRVTDIDIARLTPQDVRIFVQVTSDSWHGGYPASTNTLFYSDDFGESWELLNPTANAQFTLGRGWLAIAPSDPKTIFVTRGSGSAFSWSLFVSKDAGETWEVRALPGVVPSDYMATQVSTGTLNLWVNPIDPSDLWAAASVIHHSRPLDLYSLIHSTDQGQTWKIIDTPVTNSNMPRFYGIDIHAVEGQPTKVAIANHYDAYLSEDAGQTWVHLPFSPANDTLKSTEFGKDGRYLFVFGSNVVIRYDLARKRAVPVKERTYVADGFTPDDSWRHQVQYVPTGGLYAFGRCSATEYAAASCKALYRYAGKGT